MLDSLHLATTIEDNKGFVLWLVLALVFNIGFFVFVFNSYKNNDDVE